MRTMFCIGGMYQVDVIMEVEQISPCEAIFRTADYLKDIQVSFPDTKTMLEAMAILMDEGFVCLTAYKAKLVEENAE